jgi:N-acetyltransferase 10
MRKKIDDKIKILMENGIVLNERIMFVIVGDRGRDQVSFFIY